MTHRVPLTQGKFALVDDEDFGWICKYKWQYGGGGYPMRGVNLGNRNFITVYMHRLIMRAQPDEQVDHVNSDTLDNRRMNLRIASRTQNRWNTGKRVEEVRGPTARSSSRFIGVSQRGGRWEAKIMSNGVRYDLGHFNSEESAARAYDAKAIELRGEFARLNFPPLAS